MSSTKKITLSSMFIALGIILPFFTGQLQQFGNMLLPMHLPVFLCSLICGWKYGMVIGFILPFLRFELFGMPILYPIGIAMAFELATYGFVAGFVYEKQNWKCIKSLYKSIIIAMIVGRLVWGLVEVVLLGLGDNGFTLSLFITQAILNSIPGIILQLALIPSIMLVLHRTKLMLIKKSL